MLFYYILHMEVLYSKNNNNLLPLTHTNLVFTQDQLPWEPIRAYQLLIKLMILMIAIANQHCIDIATQWQLTDLRHCFSTQNFEFYNHKIYKTRYKPKIN